MAATPAGESLRAALNRDLKKGASEGVADVMNDATRKIFTFRKDGAVYEFAHRQPDAEYWSGVKYYGSGSRARVRIRRTPDTAEEAAAKKSTKAGATATPRKKKAATVKAVNEPEAVLA